MTATVREIDASIVNGMIHVHGTVETSTDGWTVKITDDTNQGINPNDGVRYLELRVAAPGGDVAQVITEESFSGSFQVGDEDVRSVVVRLSGNISGDDIVIAVGGA